MVKYNELVIRKYADRLYSRARTLVLMYTLVFGLAGAAGGGFLGLGLPGLGLVMLAIGGVIFGVIGFILGTNLKGRCGCGRRPSTPTSGEQTRVRTRFGSGVPRTVMKQELGNGLVQSSNV